MYMQAGRVKILWKLKYGGQNSIFFSWNPWSKFYVPWKGGSKFYICSQCLEKGGSKPRSLPTNFTEGVPPPPGGIGTLFARNFVQLTPVLRPSFLDVHFCHNTTCGTMDFSWYVDWSTFVCENVKSARNWREIVICNHWRDREILPFPRRNL